MLTSLNKDETAVVGCDFPGYMAVHMCKGPAIPWIC